MVRLYVCLSVCVSVTLVHPAKAIGRNEMSFGRDTLVVPSNTVLDRAPGPTTGRGDLGDRTGDGNTQSKFTLHIATKLLLTAELLQPIGTQQRPVQR